MIFDHCEASIRENQFRVFYRTIWQEIFVGVFNFSEWKDVEKTYTDIVDNQSLSVFFNFSEWKDVEKTYTDIVVLLLQTFKL